MSDARTEYWNCDKHRADTVEACWMCDAEAADAIRAKNARLRLALLEAIGWADEYTPVDVMNRLQELADGEEGGR